jgi:EAL and modified HD-GYP domain-containing signal transduction protein
MFIARQPIFNRQLKVYGYELLFRSNHNSIQFDGISSQGATAAVITGLYESGIDNIVEDKFAFINFDDVFIHSSALELIHPNQMVVEILENARMSDCLKKRLEVIKNKGYKIALDDFVGNCQNDPFVPYADIIKYDLFETPLETIEREVINSRVKEKIILAEKVETEEQFLKAKEMGFDLFQGYFFSKLMIVGRSCNKTPTKVQYLRIITEISKEDPSFDILAKLIEQDVTLAYRVMRMASVRSDGKLVESIKLALTYIGLKEIERWINIIMLQDLGENKPQEIMKLSLIRSRFAEALCKHAGMKNYEYLASMIGLFSMLDAILDQTMEEALTGILLPAEISDVLINHKGELYPIYELMLAYEKGDWDKVDKIQKELNIQEAGLDQEYYEAIEWSNNLISNVL